MNEELFNVSACALKRYAQHIAGKDEGFEVGKYVAEHIDEIVERISRLINYGNLLYEVYQSKHGLVQIFYNNFWVMFVSTRHNNVIALYRIDLGDKEVTNLFVNKCIERINYAKDEAAKIAKIVNKKRDEYQASIWKNEDQVKNLKKQIKELESTIDLYKTLIHNINIEEELAKKRVYEEVELLVMEKKF